MKKKLKTRWPDYERVDLKDIVTFGTTIFMRKDKKAIRIIFPAGQSIIFCPEDEIKTNKGGASKSAKCNPSKK